MPKLNIIDMDGKNVGTIDVSDSVFSSEIKEHLLWEVVRWQRAKKRAGTAKTKERSEVHGTHGKMYKQKGTGNARHSSRRVNLWRGGGQSHGPRPRSYAFSVNKKAVRGALCSALSLRVSQEALIVVKDMSVTDGKTKNLASALGKLDANKALLVDSGENQSLKRSSKNLPTANYLDPRGLNVYDIPRPPKLLISEPSPRELHARLSGTASQAGGEA